MKNYAVNQLSKLAGVSVRTLHYYDEIGLLTPPARTAAGYRLYGEDELLRLQQILFYKELGVGLDEIGRILDDPEFDLLTALKSHRALMSKKLEQFGQLLETIDKTIDKLNQKNMVSDNQLFEGFDQEAHREEAVERWGEEKVAASEANLRKMTPEQRRALQNEGEELTQRLADLMDKDPASESVQAAIADYHQHLNAFHPVSKEMFLGLGQMYVDDERFRTHYEKYAPGLADFVNEAIKVYAQ